MTQEMYANNLIQDPIREVGAGKEKRVKTTGRQIPTMTFMSNRLVSGSNTYIEFGWIFDIPSPNPHLLAHVHAHDEIVLHIGSDPNDPSYLGAEIEFVIGGEVLTINKTSALFVPKGVVHGPITWRSFERPHIQMAMILGTGELSLAAPGGFNGVKKMTVDEAFQLIEDHKKGSQG